MAPKNHADASDPDPATETGSNASPEAAASPQINAPTCRNCGDHDAISIVWRDNHGYTPLCQICTTSYNMVRDERGDNSTIHYADLSMTDRIARFCPRCDAEPAGKTVGVSPDHDAITLECHACDAFMEMDKELVTNIITNE